MRSLNLISALFLWFLFAITPAIAGDFATRAIIGFSADGNQFAFEEFGIQDGSGFPYSTIYVIYTQTYNWISGSPFRARIENEDASVEDARALAREMSGDTLSQITEAGIINATNTSLEVVDNPHRMEARPWAFNPPTDDRIEFRLEELEFFSEGLCADLGGTKGFRVSQIFKEAGKQTKLLHEDTAVPQSRGCPTSYRFADIVTYRPDGGDELIIALLVLYETFGFEGPDGRYLAVTTRMQIQ
jgi:predicted secreted protein